MQPTIPVEVKSYPPARKAWYATAVLTIAYILSFIDRQILSLLVVPIRRDLQISDTQMSLLMGFSFALFYTLFGFPIGRMADSRSRRNIITAGILTWSLFTAGCGVASSYAQMFLMRVGVGVGEAALSPPAYSMLADYFEPQRRALALSVYGLGIFLGSGMAMVLGGIIVPYTSGGGTLTVPILGVTVYGWQLTFFAVGLPGVAIAALMRTVAEPARRERQTCGGVPLRRVFDYIVKHRATFACHHMATALLTFMGYGCLAWDPTFFMRTYGYSAAQAGLTLGGLYAVCSGIGILAGGWYCGYLSRRGHSDAHFRVGLTVSLLMLPLTAAYPLMPTSGLALLLVAPLAVLRATMYGVAPAALQQVAPNEMRAQVSAMYLFVINLVGMGLGPTAIALLTDKVFHDDMMLRYSLQIATTGACALSALLWWIGLKPFRQTVDETGMLRRAA